VATAKEPAPSVKSAQTTLITTFIRKMLLNWLVLISWVAAAMMIPRLYLAAIMVSPNWAAAMDQASARAIIRTWNFPLNTLLAVGFALIAMAMCYTIIDLPSACTARLPQR